MANNCYNYLEIEGKKEDILRLEECMKSQDKNSNDELRLSKIIPAEIDERGCYKCKDIYELWGTKWFDGEWFENDGASATLTFDTAWSPSLPVTLEMSKRFNLKINHFYEESGCDFEGDYNVDCGEVILNDERKYRPVCQDCGEKFDSDDMVYDEDDGDYRCRVCADPLISLVAEKLEKIKADKIKGQTTN